MFVCTSFYLNLGMVARMTYALTGLVVVGNVLEGPFFCRRSNFSQSTPLESNKNGMCPEPGTCLWMKRNVRIENVTFDHKKISIIKYIVIWSIKTMYGLQQCQTMSLNE